MVDLQSVNVQPEVLRLISKETALQLSVLPLVEEKDSVTVALAERHDRQVVRDLTFLLGKNVRVECVSVDALHAALQRHYGVTPLELRRNTAAMTRVHSVREETRRTERSSDGSALNLADRIISEAVQLGASDIHVEPYEQEFRIRYRIDGVLHDVLQPAIEFSKPLVSRLKIMADLDIAEKRRPQDGRIRVRDGKRVIDIRVSTLPTDFGEKIVLRILDKSQLQLDLKKLGFEEHGLRLFERAIRLPYGMILVTGPTGSGKTTTLYAALHAINRPEVNITTIEDPIEYNLPGINQMHVRADIGVTFAAALRSILRQDPNVIMVGEIRDMETAEIAVRAALTGHLVFSTLHTNDAPSAVIRLIDMGVEPFLVASSVKMILAQRLLRKLCDACKDGTPPSSSEMEELKTLGLRSGQKFFKSMGCGACNQFGYKGRTAVFEVLPIDAEMSDQIAHSSVSSEIRKMALKKGLVTLREAALRKAERGETSLEEVIRETAA